MKAGDTATINGTISFIMLPKGGIFFEDVEFSIFELTLDDGSTITCKGEILTYIKKGMRVFVTGKYETNTVRNNFKGKTNPFSFRVSEIKRDLESKNGIKEFISLIAGETNARKTLNQKMVSKSSFPSSQAKQMLETSSTRLLLRKKHSKLSRPIQKNSKKFLE